ncbi:Vacuolar ATPase assembly integral membrane protein [Lodderomyces elongisporus]|uniref:Vacuolar ATPase assembly integral membrane protein n=1 Tax=Lodderomyces elongisporus TaxID=36914 RepID=UPI002926CF71|nr:Vacuolar ATPase assembly integral membrane protein [Lodderomyces elongisporus]WLF79318.1 Vacuolar ATPase assembly integral membrane protein [Lodderomyces elongisporus]
MTLFEITVQLKTLIEQSSLDKREKQKLLSNKTISHGQLIEFYNECHPTPTLLALLKKSKLHIPPYKTFIKEKTPEFLRQMERLRLEAKEKEYKQLINKSPEFATLYDNSDQEYISPAKAHKELKNQLTTIVNIAVSVGSVSYAIWYWTASSWGLKDSYRVLLTVFFGILVLVAEVVVYMGYLNKIEEARAKEKQKKEVKKVVQTFDLRNLKIDRVWKKKKEKKK